MIDIYILIHRDGAFLGFAPRQAIWRSQLAFLKAYPIEASLTKWLTW